mgnify:CR=1 FL=1
MGLEEKRAMALRLERQASEKIQQIAAGRYDPLGSRSLLHEINNGKYGVDISGTKYDPRKSERLIKRYTGKQLDAHIERLKGFNSPTVGYYSGHKGAIIESQAMRSLFNAVKISNAKKEAYVQKYEEVEPPWLGGDMTVGQYDRTFRQRIKFDGSAMTDTLKRGGFPKPSQFYRQEAVENRERKLRNFMNPAYFAQKVAGIRQNIRNMSLYTGSDLPEKFMTLDDETLYFMWTHDSNLADSLAMIYLGSLPENAEDGDSYMFEEMGEDRLRSMWEDIDEGQWSLEEAYYDTPEQWRLRNKRRRKPRNGRRRRK